MSIMVFFIHPTNVPEWSFAQAMLSARKSQFPALRTSSLCKVMICILFVCCLSLIHAGENTSQPSDTASRAPTASATTAAQPAPSKPAVEEDEFLIEGKVQTTLTPAQEITGVTLIAIALDDRDREIKVPYHVVLDSNGLQMGRDMAQKMVEVTCTVANRGTRSSPELWITVKEYQPISDYRR